MKTHYKYSIKKTDIRDSVEKRYNIVIGIIIFFVFIIIISLFNIQIVNRSIYNENMKRLKRDIIFGTSAPRGRIYDRNGKVIVDNKPTKIISYKRIGRTTTKEEIELSYLVGSMIEVNYKSLSEDSLKDFWIKNNKSLADALITKEEYKLLKERKLSNADITKLKKERISKSIIDAYTTVDKEACYIYSLMNKGYSFSEKIIKKTNITEEEYALVSENLHLLKGYHTRLDWNREYVYGDVLRYILGNVSTTETGLPYELKDYYLSLGYSLNDRVGVTNLEYQYEEYLRGVKDQFQLSEDGSLTLYKEGSRGNDIYLTIDIELQKEVERILIEEIIKAKGEVNTEYFNRSFVVITEPKTGAILAMAGKQVIEVDGEYRIYDYTPGVYTSSVVPGSIIKGASHTVGYNNGGLTIGEKRDDKCIKIAATPLKCSILYMGIVDDITAMKKSSNTYQFHTAINVGKGKYIINKPLVIDKNAFNIYRNTFAEFGLGVKTGIDLPNETTGYKGNSQLSGHLLDFAIGQYDNYTPIQISQYMSTIANNGVRMQYHLLKEVKDNDSVLVYRYSPVELNKVKTEDKYMERIQTGFKEVFTPGGTAYRLVDLSLNPAGKTGTSESFIDTDGDGKIDTATISNTFALYAPYDNPIASFTFISPDISHPDAETDFKTRVNKRIGTEVVKKFFEIYK